MLLIEELKNTQWQCEEPIVWENTYSWKKKKVIFKQKPGGVS